MRQSTSEGGGLMANSRGFGGGSGGGDDPSDLGARFAFGEEGKNNTPSP